MIGSLEPYPAMKDSGVPWLGEVPRHWSTPRLKAVFQEVDRRSGTGEEPLLSLRMALGLVDHHAMGGKPIPPSSLVHYKRTQPGEIVMNRMRAAAGLFAATRTVGLVSPDYAVLRPRTRVDLQYFVHLFRTPIMMSIFRLESRGLGTGESGFLRLYTERFGMLAAPFPPPDEQAVIVRFLDHADRRIRRYIGAKQKLIKLLEEQKQAIIHRAVTRGFDPNVRLKPSSVEWLGDVPEHWQVKRLKWVTRLQRGYDLPADQRIPGPFPVVSSGGVIGCHCEARSSGPGVVMGRYGSTDAVFFLETDFWPHNTSLFVTDFQGNRPRWCYFMLRTISKADHAGKSAVPGVDRKDLFDIVVTTPPVSEQGGIVAWIESESATLDRAIGTAEHEISLLREYRTRLIADVVTGKLDVREAAALLPEETDQFVPDVAETDDVEGSEEDDDRPVVTDLNLLPGSSDSEDRPFRGASRGK